MVLARSHSESEFSVPPGNIEYVHRAGNLITLGHKTVPVSLSCYLYDRLVLLYYVCGYIYCTSTVFLVLSVNSAINVRQKNVIESRKVAQICLHL